MRLVRYAAAAAVAAVPLALASPAAATCMPHGDVKGIVRVYSCAPPGGPVTTYVCVGDVCRPL